MKPSDIVARLRRLASDFPTLNGWMDNEWTNAADEIERLRVIVQGWEHSARNAERDIETLRAERDEARREVCDFCESGDEWNAPEVAREIAEERGWDCFKEEP